MKDQIHNMKITKFRSSLIALTSLGVASFAWWLTSSAAFAPNFPLSSSPASNPISEIEQSQEILEQDLYQEIDETVKSGDTLTHIFERHHLKTADLYKILQLKQFKPQLSQLQLNQKVFILHDNDGNVVDLILHLGEDRELQIYRNDFGFDGEILQDDEPVLVSLAQHSMVEADAVLANIPVEIKSQQTPNFESNRLALKIKSGDTLYKIFRHYQLSLGDLERILRLHRKSRSQLQNLRINQKLIVTRADNNHVESLSLVIDSKKTLHFTKKANSFQGEIEQNGTRVALDYEPPRQQVAQRQQQVKQVEQRKKSAPTPQREHTPTTAQVQKDTNLDKARTPQVYSYQKAAMPELSEMIESAKKYLGYPYRYGGVSPSGFDCSGFVIYNSKKVGISHLPRTAHQQYQHTKPISRDELQPGDLVFFHSRNNRKRIGHVGIYIGDDKFIHARAKGAKDVTITSLNNSYYRKHFVRGGRL